MRSQVNIEDDIITTQYILRSRIMKNRFCNAIRIDLLHTLNGLDISLEDILDTISEEHRHHA